jgi:endonuclease YncB( thermonuclease family)
MRKLILTLSLAVLVACGSTQARQASVHMKGTVIKHADGDTIYVDVNDKIVKVRLLGVDTPETHDPRKPVQCYGPEASAFTASYANGLVSIVTEPTTGDVTDRYGRTLAYVYVYSHRRDLGATLLRRGFARVYAFGNRHFVKRPAYEKLQAAAQTKHVGRWGHC